MSLFSGIGAPEKALERLNIDYDLIGFSEIDKYAIKSYCAIHNEDKNKNLGDVTKIDEKKLPDFDMLIGGFPCQAFSVAGKRKGFEDIRGTLFFELARIAKYKQPKYILCENVKGLINHDRGNTLNVIIQTLCDIGYTVDFQLLNAKYFNVPQNRERIFIIAIRDDLVKTEKWSIKGNNIITKGKKRIEQLDGIKTFNFGWIEQNNVSKRLRDILEPKVEEKFYLSEEKTNKLVGHLEEKQKTKELKVVQMNQQRNLYVKNIVGTLHASMTNNQAPKILEPVLIGRIELNGYDIVKRVYDPIGVSPTLTTMGEGHQQPKIVEIQQYSDGSGLSHCIDANYFKGTSVGDIGKGRRTQVIEEVRPVLTPDRLEKRQNGKRFKDNDEPAFTVNTQDRYGVAIGIEHKYRIRKLTPLECFRLMGFDDKDFYAAQDQCSNSQLYKQAGNSIVVNVLESIFTELNNTYFNK